ncbi:cyclic GMP-AMP synthase-like receptor [Uloborus diversus]|uniref:cyclic GMP-AMP synthase-like receptor n=1 Tax=Uloborus diversus TaxID=327109 RepID=UPI002409E44E|nr:cyclic GMP-AMP synthase-like receptor [Uloborus diversus]
MKGFMNACMKMGQSMPTSPEMESQAENQSLQPKKLRNPMVTILKEILREEIKMEDDLKKENKAILKDFLETFVSRMKSKDETFNLLYQRNYYTGSSFSGLRISRPDEYDINLVLKLPYSANDIEVQFQPQTPSFVKYKIKNPEKYQEKYGKLAPFIKDGYLMPKKLRTWIQGVVDKARVSYQVPQKCKSLTPGSSGPAVTVYLNKENGDKIDIDLVLTFECALKEKPPGIDGRVYERVKNKLQCFLVPKSYQKSNPSPINDQECDRLWRTHFPVAENDIINDKGCVKPVIKLLKLLRDKENWKILASYYLKTVVMWMVLSNPNQEYWREDKMGERFIEALKKLADYVKNKKLPYFFSSKQNLLYKMGDVQSNNIFFRLTRIIRDIESDPSTLWKIFHVKPTFQT